MSPFLVDKSVFIHCFQAGWNQPAGHKIEVVFVFTGYLQIMPGHWFISVKVIPLQLDLRHLRARDAAQADTHLLW